MEIKQALKRLCGQSAPSGFEGAAVHVAAELLRPLMDEVYIHRSGSVVGVRRCGKPGAKKLLLDAHLDEIGLMVVGIEEGFLRFRSIGGVDPRMLPDREVTVLTQTPIFGVVACLPPHVQVQGDGGKSIPIPELMVDIGMTQEQAEQAVPLGTPIVFRGDCFELGQEQMCGKSMDDRSCFVTLLRAMELLQDSVLDVDVYVLGSVGEEFSGVGAKTAAFSIAPDFCVAVDVTHGQTPDGQKDRTFTLGGGPAIGMGPNMTGWMTRRMIDKAKAIGMDYQIEVMGGHTGTNGWYFQIAREGIATSVLSLPLKYMHSPVETLNLRDMEAVAGLLAAFTRNLGEEAETLC